LLVDREARFQQVDVLLPGAVLGSNELSSRFHVLSVARSEPVRGGAA
jgi:hypothetical protein